MWPTGNECQGSGNQFPAASVTIMKGDRRRDIDDSRNNKRPLTGQRSEGGKVKETKPPTDRKLLDNHLFDNADKTSAKIVKKE